VAAQHCHKLKLLLLPSQRAHLCSLLCDQAAAKHERVGLPAAPVIRGEPIVSQRQVGLAGCCCWPKQQRKHCCQDHEWSSHAPPLLLLLLLLMLLMPALV
jgi:hypothetical protein